MAIIDKKYHQLLNKILADGFKYKDPNRKGINRIQVASTNIRHNFSDGFPAITTKKLYWKGIVGELLWFLRGDTNIKYLVDNNINIWNKDAYNYYLSKRHSNQKAMSFEKFVLEVKTKRPNSNLGHLGRVYGAQWRNWKSFNNGLFADFEEGVHDDKKIGTDQISNLIKGIKENPMSTQHIVTACNPAELDKMALPPCHWSFEILVEPLNLEQRFRLQHNRGLHNGFSKFEIETGLNMLNTPKYQFTLKWHQRSVDTFLGLPFNIASYALLANIIGEIANMVPLAIEGDLSNVHIYEPHLPSVNEQLKRSTTLYNSTTNLILSDNVKALCALYNKGDISLDELFDKMTIKDFNLTPFNSLPAINAEMIPRDK